MKLPVADNTTKYGQPSFAVSNGAQKLLQQAVSSLVTLELLHSSSPLDSQFYAVYRQFVSIVDLYHAEMLRKSEYSLGCTKGCSSCCYHWVEDVNSFEGQIIAEYIKTHLPGEVNRITKECNDDCEELLRLEHMVSEKVDEQKKIGTIEVLPDTMDLLLSVFYQMRRPCPLLSREGTCMIYPVRPLTCRMYVSVSEPFRCDPDYINDAVIPTCILDLNDSANHVLDTLHVRYRTGDTDDTGLRSQLAQYLS